MSYVIFDIETIGLTPMDSRILSIGISKDGNMDIFHGEDEIETLREFWEKIDDEDILVGYNSDSFDIPFLLTRSLINNIKVVKFQSSKDLRKIVSGFWFSYNQYAKGKLGDWAKILGIEVKSENGIMMNELYKRGEWEEIKKHNKEDIVITRTLFERVRECGLL